MSRIATALAALALFTLGLTISALGVDDEASQWSRLPREDVIAGQVIYLDGHECFEDEAVVMLMETWTGTHHEIARDTGKLYCVPVDDMRPVSP